jgi:hypothetical protein
MAQSGIRTASAKYGITNEDPIVYVVDDDASLRDANYPVGLLPHTEHKSSVFQLSPEKPIFLVTEARIRREFFGDLRLEKLAALGMSPDQFVDSVPCSAQTGR